MKEKQLKLNPDAFSRFQVVSNEIQSVYGKNKVKLLDIGGASTYLYDFLTINGINFDLTIIDIVDFDNKPEKATVVIQSAEKTGFGNNSFDVVTGIDMLEHLPNETVKRNIINEAIRVSKDLVIFAGPCDEQQVTEFEQRLNNQNKLLFSKDQKWLAEHFEFGKPSKELLKKCYTSASLSRKVFSVLPLSDWYISSVANLSPAVNASVSLKNLEKLNEQYNQRFFSDNQYIPEESIYQQGYRTFYVGSKIHKLGDLKPYEPQLLHPPEDYVDVLVAGLNGTRQYNTQENDIKWYAAETKRLKDEVQSLAEQNQQLMRSVKNLAGGKIVHKVRSLEHRIQKRRTND